MEVINAIKHYQRNIEKCSGNEERMLHCLHKLYRLPVTVQHLQETGVGRTVNALRKYEGDAGEAAKALVNKWKAMVAEADSEEDVADEKSPSRTESPPPKSSSHRHKSSNSESHKEVNRKEKYRSKEKGSSGSNHRDKSKDEKSSSKTKHMDHGHKRRHDEEGRKDEEKRRRKNINIEDDSDIEEEEQICNGQDSSEENEESDNTSEDESNREEDEPEEASNSEEEVQQDGSDSSEEEQTPIAHVKHKSGDCDNRHSSSSSHSKSNTHSSHRSKNNREDHKSEKSRDKSHHSTDHRHSVNTDTRSSSSSKANNRSSSVHSNKETEVRSKEKGRPQEKEKNKEKERVKIVEKTKDKFEDIKDSSRTVEQKEKKHDDKRERSKTEERKDKVKSGEKAERHKMDEKIRDAKDKKADETRKSHNSNENPKSRSSSSISSSSKSSSSKIDKNKISNSKQANASVDGVEDGIDSFSGTSFADALGMMGAMDTVVKKKKKVASSSSSNSKKADGSSVHKGRNSSSNVEKSTESTSQKSSPHAKLTRSTDDVNLLDPSLQLEPLDQIEMEVDVDATLPAINPNYRPLPHFNFDMPSRARVKALSEEEALSQVMSTKNQRTKVYSGVKTNKSWSTVPSLFDICVRVLQENIDALEYTGGVPYDLLRPVLVQASPEQLFTLEHYNPYLVEDTDELWQAHVKKKFRNKSRLDMETYREMYQRCVEESEAKLKALTQNIQNSMAKSLPVRQTKLAYVDSIAKPPRQVARKQAKFGTANATAVTPMAKVQKLTSPSSANSSASPVIHVPAPAPARSSQSAKVKPRMAPLMQKTMKLAKSFKR